MRGVKGVKQSYRQVLDECKGGEIRSVFSVEENKESELEKFFESEYIPQRIKNKIQLKNIAVESPESIYYKGTDDKQLRETKIIPRGSFASADTEISIFDNNLHCMSFYENSCFALMLKDKSLVSMLTSIFDILWSSAEKMRFYDGVGGIKESYLKMLSECKSKEIFAFLSIVEEEELDLQDFFTDIYVPNRVEKGIKMKNIALRSPKTIEYKLNDNDELRETKLIDEDKFPLVNCEINVFDEFLHFMSFNNGKAFAVIVKDDCVAKMVRAIFKILWDK